MGLQLIKRFGLDHNRLHKTIETALPTYGNMTMAVVLEYSAWSWTGNRKMPFVGILIPVILPT